MHNPLIEVSLIVADIKMDENSSFHIFVFRCCGGLLIYTLGYFLGPQWKTLAFICCPVPILAFLASTYSPQSPVFLVSHGEEPEALSAIKKLYGPQYDSNMELAMIKKGLGRHKSIFKSFKRKKDPTKNVIREEDVKESGKCAKFLNLLHFDKKSQMIEMFKKPEVYKPFQIIVLLGFVQQFSGMTILRSYVVKIFNDIFEKDGNPKGCVAKEAYIAAIIIGLTRLISSLLLSKLLYHFARRRIYFLSGKSTFFVRNIK